MAAAFRLSDSQRERGVIIGGDDLPPGSPAFIRVPPRAGEPAIALYEGRRGRQDGRRFPGFRHAGVRDRVGPGCSADPIARELSPQLQSGGG